MGNKNPRETESFTDEPDRSVYSDRPDRSEIPSEEYPSNPDTGNPSPDQADQQNDADKPR